ncbi:MAG: DNA methyltransferase, partial [Candidatus Edwardsbacteria bacterium]|nr:DNA methyltransferase [Candidatus Edwardsbacteria bacterium]
MAQQYKEEPLTDFASVNEHTPLESLNLNWRERDLPERERTKHVHRLHPYMGKFIPQLVEIFIRKFKPKLVYDPFCGSGTTLVEANILGVDSIGVDISAFNVLLSKVKTNKYNVKKVRDEIFDILMKTHESIKKHNINSFTTDNEYINAWFSPKARQELLCYASFIKNYENSDLLKIILSRSARSA